MFITGLGTAAPPKVYAQKECWEALTKSLLYPKLSSRARAVFKKVLTGNNGITNRHLALESLEEAFDLTPDALHARFLRNAPLLAAQAGQQALADAGNSPQDIDAVIISTCTGYLCPGLTSYVTEKLRLRSDVLALDLVGQGCGAAIPNLRTAEALLAAGKCKRVLSICVEVCSAALYFDEDPGVIISACLFGDGAGAAVLADSSKNGCQVRWHASGSVLNPNDRDLLRFEQKHGMLRNILSAQVPTLAAPQVQKVLEDVLERAGIQRSELRAWVLHPGGRDVLAAVRQQLGLSEQDTRCSEAILREFGNLSSPSVFFVLQAALADSAPDGWWWLSSFGAGFSCHGALLEVKRDKRNTGSMGA